MKTIEHKGYSFKVAEDATESDINTIKANITKSTNLIDNMKKSLNDISYDNVDSEVELAPHVPKNVEDLPLHLIYYITRSLQTEFDEKHGKRSSIIADEESNLLSYIAELNHDYVHLTSDFIADKLITKCIDELHKEDVQQYDDRLRPIGFTTPDNNKAHKKMVEYDNLIKRDEHKIIELREDVVKALSNGFTRIGVYASFDRRGGDGYYSEWKNLETGEVQNSPTFASKGEAGSFVIGGALSIDKPLTFKVKLSAIQAINNGDIKLAKTILFNKVD